MSTIQVDFQFPQRFDLHYAGDDNARHRPIMIHRALFGSVERFFGVLTEHYAGAFPLWLAPEQVRLAPVADRHVGPRERPRRGSSRARGSASVRGRLEGVGGQEDPRGAADEGPVHPRDRRPRARVRRVHRPRPRGHRDAGRDRSARSWRGARSTRSPPARSRSRASGTDGRDGPPVEPLADGVHRVARAGSGADGCVFCDAARARRARRRADPAPRRTGVRDPREVSRTTPGTCWSCRSATAAMSRTSPPRRAPRSTRCCSGPCGRCARPRRRTASTWA